MRGVFFCIFNIMLLCDAAEAQIISLNKPTAIRPEIATGSITIALATPVVTFALHPGGIATGTPGISITTTEVSVKGVSAVSMYGFFTTTKALVDTAGDSIPTSSVLGLCGTGSPTSYTAFTQSGPFGVGTSLLIWRGTATGHLADVRTDILSLEINLGAISTLPVATYNGTLMLQVQAF